MRKPILFDGAFGTYYHSIHPSLDFPELANLVDPSTVRRIHREYIDSGAEAILTNTFGANPTLHTDWAIVRRVLRQGYELACEAAAEQAAVYADIGPVTTEQAATAYQQIAAVFLDCGAKKFLFETLPDLSGIQETVDLIRRRRADAEIILSFAVTQDGYSKTGEWFGDLFREARSIGADVVGLNCICGPAHLLKLTRRIDPTAGPVLIMPNAGYPSVVNGRSIFVDNPEYFSDKLAQIAACGVWGVGGCCGTTPRHIRAAAERLGSAETSATGQQTVKKNEPAPSVPSVSPQHSEPSKPTVSPANRFAQHKPLVAVEIGSPVDTDIDFLMHACQAVKQHGADFVTFPDSPMAKARANSMMMASMIRRAVGIETIPHLCCRDQNQVAIKGALIAGQIEGLRQILCITGDPIPETDRAEIRHVFGFNAVRLIRFIDRLNGELFAETPYRICGALNTSARNFDAELRRAEEKIQNGAQCLFTQPLFAEADIARFRLAQQMLSCKIFAGIMPLAGYKNARYLNNEVPGIEIPEHLIASLRDKNAEEARTICLSFAKSTVDQIYEQIDGYYLMTPLKKVDLSLELLDYIRRDTPCISLVKN